jgi:hypothetical protein
MDKENMVCTQSQSLKNEIISFVGKWMELEVIKQKKKTKLPKTSTSCFLSYVEFREDKRTLNLKRDH